MSIKIGEYIQKLRESNNLSQRRLGELAEVSNTEISRIESGERQEVSPSVLKAIAPFLGVSYGKLMQVAGYIETAGRILKRRREHLDIPVEKCAELSGLSPEIISAIEDFLDAEEIVLEAWVKYGMSLNLNRSQVLLIKSYDFMTFNIDQFDRIFTASIISSSQENEHEKIKLEFAEYIDLYVKPTEKMVKIPVLGVIRAGLPIHTQDNIIGYETLPAKEVNDGDYFYLQVTGDSMVDAHILPNSRILVRRQKDLKDGEIGVFLIKGDESSVKRITRNDGKIILYAANSAYPPQMYNPNDVEILGKVVKVETKFE